MRNGRCLLRLPHQGGKAADARQPDDICRRNMPNSIGPQAKSISLTIDRHRVSRNKNMARRKGSKNKLTLAREAALDVAAKRAAILGTDLPDLKVSLDSLAVLEQAMRHFYIKAMVEKSLGERADWKAVDAAMVQAAAMAEKVATYRHPKLSTVRLAGELNKKPTDGATLDELLARIKTELTKLGPILDLEVVREPEGARTERRVTVGSQTIEHGRRSGA